MADAEERLRASVETFTAGGDTHAAARAASTLGIALWRLDRADEALATLRPAFDALADEEHDVDIGKLAAELARIEHFTGDQERARQHIELALDVAETHGDMALLSQALNTKTLVLARLRVHEQQALLREAIRIAEEHDLTEPLMRAINNLMVLAQTSDRSAEADELLGRGLAIARARGHRLWLTTFGAGLAMSHYNNAEWDDAFAVAAETLPEGIQHSANPIFNALLFAKMSFERGDDDGARAWLARTPPNIAESSDRNYAALGAVGQALDAFLAGQVKEGIDDLTRMWDIRAAAEEWAAAGDALEIAADFAVLLGDPAATRPLLERYETVPEPALTRSLRTQGGRLRAFGAVAAGEEDVAADAFVEALAAARSLGLAVYTTHLLADYGVWLVECGRGAEAEPLLDEAREQFERMGARRCLERIDAVRPKEPVAA